MFSMKKTMVACSGRHVNTYVLKIHLVVFTVLVQIYCCGIPKYEKWSLIWKSLTHGKETKHCSSQPWWRLLMHYCNYGTVGKCEGGEIPETISRRKKQISSWGCVSASMISKHQDAKLKCCADTCLMACSSGGIGCSFYCCSLGFKPISYLIAMPGIHFKDKIYTC